MQGSNAVQDYPVLARSLAELKEARGQPRRLQQLAIGLDHDIAIGDVIGTFNVVAIEESVIKVTQVTRLLCDRDLLGETCAEGVSSRYDDAVFNTQLKKCIADRANLGDEIGVWDRDLAVLVSTLLLV